jgi:signal transduction histidine kinase/DNA-binding response OmpR family regulator
MESNRSFSIFSKIKTIRPLYLQMLFVLMAFALMVVSGSLYVSYMLKRHLRIDALEMLTQTKLKIEGELVGPETTVITISKTIRAMLLLGDDEGRIAAYIQTIVDELQNNTDGFIFNNLYGYFDVFGGKFIHAPYWEPPENYDPTTRPWYNTAIEAGNNVAFTPIFINLRLNDYVITYVQRIFDEDGYPLGIVCLDVPLDRIIGFVADINLTKGSYGVFHDENMNIFYHPNSDLIGKHSSEIGSGISALANEVLAGGDLFEREIKNHAGELSVVFSDRLDCGWVLYIVTSKTEYYRELQEIEIILGTLGILLAAALIVILVSVDKARNKSDTLLAKIEKEREADELTQIMLNATPLGCKFWDKNLNIIECNEEALHLFGLQSKQEFFDRFHECSPEYQPCGKISKELVSENIHKAFQEGTVRFEWMHQTITGEPIPSEITLVRVKYRGEFAVAGYIRDLRELNAMLAEMHKTEQELRVAHDAAQAANQAKSAFLANMSHEIRTPMNSIVGFSELALDADISSSTKNYLDRILENAEGLLQIINDILDISKIESGKMELEHIPFDLHEIIIHCQTAIMPKAVEQGVTMRFYAEPSVGKTLLGDPTRLRQILINLLSNAIKFTNLGTVKLFCSIISSAENSITMSFEVMDNGIGMSQEKITTIYEPFAQADSSTTRKYGGTGLGLPISKNLIELMGGRLTVESTIGVGSKFSFQITFDTIDSPEYKRARETSFSEIEKPVFEGEILVCEDNQMNQQVIIDHLARVGIKAIIAANGSEGVSMVQKRMEAGEKPFNLIFMDIHMPVMDGIEAASKITALGSLTPIVAMTANIMANEKEMYKESGMPDYVGKPFTSQELWHCLLKYLKPVDRKIVDKNVQSKEDEQFIKKLQISFAKQNQIKFDEIANALKADDIKLAHRLAHTLKTNAGQLGKKQLQKAAAEIEHFLEDGQDLVTEKQLNVLKNELNEVLEEFAPLLSAQIPAGISVKAAGFDVKKASELAEKLETLLRKGSPESLKLVDDLYAIPGSETLIEQIEEFNFDAALVTLHKMEIFYK